MKRYIVSYKRDEDGPTCTNIAIAATDWQVEEHYCDCAWWHIEEAPDWKVTELEAKHCPVVECRWSFDGEYNTRLIDVTTIEDNEYWLVYTYYGLYILLNPRDDGKAVYYDAVEFGSDNPRDVMTYWLDMDR